MLLLILFLLIIGTFLNPISALLIFLPIIQGLGEHAHVNPVHLGLVTTMTLSIGLVTPPYGVCLLVAAQIGNVSLMRATAAVLPICLITVLIIILTLFVPDRARPSEVGDPAGLRTLRGRINADGVAQ